jgi:DNA-binding HxlR family transcriptional regulator
MRRKSFASMGCSLASALEAIGDVWSVLILRDLMFGLHRYDDLQASLQIASDTLAARLKSLETVGLIQRKPYSEKPLRYEYWLTPKGLDLRTALMALAEWDERWSGRAPEAPIMAFQDGRTLRPVTIGPIDTTTGSAVPGASVRIKLGAGAGPEAHRRAELSRKRSGERKIGLA